MLAREEKKIPLVCFEVELSQKGLLVSRYYLQIEALRVIVSEIMDCGLPEVELVVEDFQAFYRSLTVIQNENFWDIIDIINKELVGKFSEFGFGNIWDNKQYDQWAVTEEIVLTMESFGDMMLSPFKEEIELVRRQCQGNYPHILEKYLVGNSQRVSAERVKPLFWDGSYHADFSINEKQAKVISAYQNAQLLSVNGPPGTGKTTVLKEIIADNIVKKTKEIVSVWNKDWTLIGNNKQQVYISPLNGMCNYSMMITSTNNKAVDNIGVELLKEVDYFSEAISGNEKGYKGILCAKLGKWENMQEFRNIILTPFIEFLEGASYDEEVAENWMAEFFAVEEDLERYRDFNSGYLSKRTEICEKLKKLNLDEGQMSKDEVEKVLSQLEGNIACIEKKKQESEKIVIDSKETMDQCLQRVFDIADRLDALNGKIKIKEGNLEEIKKKSQFILVGKLLEMLAERKLGTKEVLATEIEQLVKDSKFLVEAKKQNEDMHAKAEKERERQENLIKEYIGYIQREDEKKAALVDWLNLYDNFQHFSQTYAKKLCWDDPEYKFNTCAEITAKRNTLFLLSIQILEMYIKKYAYAIKYNLEKVYSDNWFQVFYRRDYEYDKNYVKYLKAMWETIFLCFPVVTTTLYALDRKKFHLIPEIFDTLLIDEAGQALIHTAVGPLFRFRRAVIVGDVNQLEPIRIVMDNSLINRIDLPVQVKEIIDIEKNSIQNAADSGSEIFDILNRQEVGIVLEEHRRCENAIVQFSNQYVYDKCLKIVKRDEEKEFLGKNFVMIDIRGVKNSANQNTSEAEVCKRIIEMLVQIYGEEYKKKIGIITPYKGQRSLLEKSIPGVDTGTVHIFQGQEKEVIVMSMVVDNTKKNSGTYFVGNKPNILNVAFTRAKKQLILVGNYEACNESGNYLSYAMTSLRQYGRLYSLYEPDIMREKQIEEKYLRQFWKIVSSSEIGNEAYKLILSKYVQNGLIVGAGNHFNFLKEILSCTPNSVKIICPWITHYVVDQSFLQCIQKMKQCHKIVRICFGYHKKGYTLKEVDKIVNCDCFGEKKEDYRKVIESLKNILEKDLRYQPPLHSKILIINDDLMIVTSHNWLSNNGEHKDAKDEIGCLICDRSAIEFVNQRYELK